MAENNEGLGSLFMDSFCCKICSKFLDDPVQCQNNEHYFCRKCITKHLENSETCPLCMDQLTLETLRPPSRIVLEIVSQLKKPRCRRVSRGCTENVEVEDVLLHEQTCAYAPVVCSNEGCKETVNRRDQESHEKKECKFRKITCESCDEELVYVDYERHQCTLRKEINDIKLRLEEMNKSLHTPTSTQTQILDDQSIKGLQNPRRRTSCTTFLREPTVAMNGQIFIFGGSYQGEDSKSFEVFNWSTKKWTLIKNCLFFGRVCSFSFIYGKKIMICGGNSTERVEFLNPSDTGCIVTLVAASLSSNARHSGLLYKDRILTFNNNVVVETSLETLEESRTLLQLKQGRNYTACVHLFEDNIYIVGRNESKIEKYDVAKNEMKTLSSLPFKVLAMATVAYKDNIIIIGGHDGEQSLSDVVMFNVTTQEYKKLPAMLEERRCCTAVIMGDVIVVMGGNNDENLNTAEYYVIGDSAWQKLPAMNLARSSATACVYV